MKKIKVTIRKPGWFPKEIELTIRETKTGYPYLPDWNFLKEALGCKMEEKGGQNG